MARIRHLAWRHANPYDNEQHHDRLRLRDSRHRHDLVWLPNGLYRCHWTHRCNRNNRCCVDRNWSDRSDRYDGCRFVRCWPHWPHWPDGHHRPDGDNGRGFNGYGPNRNHWCPRTGWPNGNDGRSFERRGSDWTDWYDGSPGLDWPDWFRFDRCWPDRPDRSIRHGCQPGI